MLNTPSADHIVDIIALDHESAEDAMTNENIALGLLELWTFQK